MSELDPLSALNAGAPARAASRTTGQTGRFAVILLIELWERFGYYGMQALLLLYLVQRLGFGDARANLLWGAFAALTYAAPAVGGWLGDQWLGSRRAMVAGACCLAAGYALLTVPSDTPALLGLAMGTISIGNGLFKPNASNLVRRIYDGEDSRLDAAFTIYYMAVNVGSTASMLLLPWMRDRLGWHGAFGFCTAGLLIGLTSYSLLRRRLAGIGSAPDFRPLPRRTGLLIAGGVLAAILLVALVLHSAGVARFCVWLAGGATLLAWIVAYRKASGTERPGLLCAYLLVVEVMGYFVFYQQQATSLTLFALRNVRPEFSFGGVRLFSFSAAQFQALNPIWIMAMSPLLAALYNRLGRSGRDLPVAAKFALGFVCVTSAFLLWWATTGAGTGPLVSPWLMVAGYGLLSLGELLVSGLGLAMIARYAPARLGAFMMGAYFVGNGIAMYVGSALANLASLPAGLAEAGPAESLPVYHHLFGELGVLGGGITLVCFLLLPVLRRLDRAHGATRS